MCCMWLCTLHAWLCYKGYMSVNSLNLFIYFLKYAFVFCSLTIGRDPCVDITSTYWFTLNAVRNASYLVNLFSHGRPNITSSYLTFLLSLSPWAPVMSFLLKPFCFFFHKHLSTHLFLPFCLFQFCFSSSDLSPFTFLSLLAAGPTSLHLLPLLLDQWIHPASPFLIYVSSF